MSATVEIVPRAAESEAIVFKLYRYTPSPGAAVIAVVVIAILTGFHTWRMVRARNWYFMAFTIWGVFQTLGYCGRIWSHYDTTAIGEYVIQAILILIAPTLYAAPIYMILGRLIRGLRAKRLFLIPVQWLSGGGGIQSGTLELFQLGEKIIIARLWVQIVIFGLFVVTAVLFHYKLSRNLATTAASGEITWHRNLHVLYGASFLVLVRGIFQVIEYL
ncbi:hypothetical protein QQZ08_001826 [Neonectria magnoliae]|uniref:Uncharacterized protein n=1 Tax=Neonectria magnoliae TaxID=2732573 RepID=A0ABR1IDE7_9HYPO